MQRFRTHGGAKGVHFSSNEDQGNSQERKKKFNFAIAIACDELRFCKVEKEERDKKTNQTIRFDMEGELDQADLLSCGKHFARSCPDCLGNCPNIKECKYCNNLSYYNIVLLYFSFIVLLYFSCLGRLNSRSCQSMSE